MTQPIEPGAMAVMVRDSVDLYNGYVLRKGFEFEVEEFEADDGKHKDDPGYIVGDYYMGHTPGEYSDVCVPAQDVALLRSKADMDARQEPTPAELAEWVADSLGDFKDTGSIHSADLNGKHNGEVEFYGTTPEGLTFGFKVEVTQIWETDV